MKLKSLLLSAALLFGAVDVANSQSFPVYRFRDTVGGSYFFTIDANERDNILRTIPQYAYEGVGFYAYPRGFCPTILPLGPNRCVIVMRYRNTQTNEHLFTANSAEEAAIPRLLVYVNEGQAFFTDSGFQGGSGVFRIRSLSNGAHLLVTLGQERTQLLASGQFADEGIAFFQPTDAPLPVTPLPSVITPMVPIPPASPPAPVAPPAGRPPPRQ